MPVPILDPHRIRRPHRTGKRIEWSVSRRTHLRFRELLHELVELEDYDQTDPYVRERIATLQDDIRHLPGYPCSYDCERDVIVPTVTTAQR